MTTQPSDPPAHTWDIAEIFTYRTREQEHCDDEVIFYDCELLVDFGPFSKGDQCDITIYPQTWGAFTMTVQHLESGKEIEFVPVWTPLSEKT